MSHPKDAKALLQDAILHGRAIVVAGTGVSIAASQHPQASWTGLLESGLALLARHHVIDDASVNAHGTLLHSRPSTSQFIATAQAITSEMSPKMFRGWLQDTIGSIKAKDRELLDVLEEIRQYKNVLATTNYDGLLLENRPALSPVTWRDKAAFLTAYRDRDHSKVLFLHGYWDVPDSVILDEQSYRDISRDNEYREKLAAVWLTSTWIYVGCGESGLSDPDLGLLLQVYGKRARDDGHWDFLLATNGERTRLQGIFDKEEMNVCVVGYGDKHSDLRPFLRSLLPKPFATASASGGTAMSAHTPSSRSTIPRPPAFYAATDYIGRHNFIGRQAQLKTLSEWAKPSDPTSVLLFEAIGGNGKSMLTWEWAKDEKKRYATTVRNWAGRFWYSFYEKGAEMRDFCRHALAYMTQQPLTAFEKRTTADMRVELLAQLHQRPWLLILDGLERVLVAYHRIDAAEVSDEEVNRPTDKVLDHRDPCDAIHDEDTDLLRALASAAPSKILISSRLIPRVLLNQAGLPLPGVKPLVLPGLDEADAEELLRSCGIQGTSADIRYYLKNYCENHPLVIGVLAGLINSPERHRGNFDAWAADPAYGAKLNLAGLDLIQRRNHILLTALEALEPASRQLLSTLALLSSAVDYETVAAFNPHLPPEPDEVEEPTKPEESWHWNGTEFLRWDKISGEEKTKLRQEYEEALAKRKDYEQALQQWRDSAAVREAPKKLAETMRNLERRGLLQYDGRTNRYDLHPVVRGVAAGGMAADDKQRYGQRVVDYYSSQPHDPYREARTMEDVENGLHVVRTLLKLGHYQQAADAYRWDLADALFFNLEACVDVLSLLRLFFPGNWDRLPKDVEASAASRLANDAAMALDFCGEYQKALGAYAASLVTDLEIEDWSGVNTVLRNISANLLDQNLLAKALRVTDLAVALALVQQEEEAIFTGRLKQFFRQSKIGQWQEAEATWRLLDPMGRSWSRAVYRQGKAEECFAQFQFWQGALREDHLMAAATLAEQDDNRLTLRDLHRLHGSWQLEQGKWELAAASFKQAVTMARERRLVDEDSETGLALAKFQLGQLEFDDARTEAVRLAQLRRPAHRTLAQLWQALGDLEQAKHHALKAYAWAWADGEPYVNRYELNKSTALLNELGVPIPTLPPYNPTQDKPFPWEADVRAAIEKLKAEKDVSNDLGSEETQVK